MRRYQNFLVFHRSRAAIDVAYEICDALPAHERYGIASQLRRAVISVKSNIVEGASRSKKQFQQFLRVAEGSAAEARELLRDIIRLGYDVLGKAEALQLEYAEILLMLQALRRNLRD